MAKRRRPGATQPAPATKREWLDKIAIAAVGVVAVSLLNILIFPPKWRMSTVDAQNMEGRVIPAAAVKPGPAPPRDFYSLPCTRWIAFRRLWSRYTNEPKPIGEVYTLADGGGWLPATSWHSAALALQAQRKTQPGAGTGSLPFQLADPADWPEYAFFQSADSSDPAAIVVSQFTVGDNERVAMKASALRVEKRICY